MLLAIGCLASVAFAVVKNRSQPPVTVTLHVAVSPGDQSRAVVSEANSAKFKYLVGKRSGIKPVLAQKLSVKSQLNSSLVEARLGVLTKDEGRRYADAFVDSLRDFCGPQVQLSLADQSIR